MLRYGIFGGLWLVLMYSGLQVQKLELGHSFCGPWGCGPPTAAMLGMHLFWTAAILPPAIFLSRMVRLNWRLIGLVLAAVSLSFLVGFAVYDFLGDNRAYYERGYVWQRYSLSLASLVDVPVTQCLFTGGLLFFVGRGCPCCEVNEQSDQEMLPVVSE